MAICNNCGHDNEEGKVFCESCGSELGTSKILEQYSVDQPFSDHLCSSGCGLPDHLSDRPD